MTTDHDYDALLVVSFGGPEGPADVDSFLDNVFRGLRVPAETKAHIAKRYEHVGGVSPINAHTRAFIKALQHELDAHGPALPIYWGNRNWHPLLVDTVGRMAEDGVRNALAFVTSAYSSYSSCRQYLENISDAQAQVGSGAPRIEKLRQFYNHPLFIEANVEHIRAALDQAHDAQLVFTAHSIPESMAANCDYATQLAETGGLIARELNVDNWQLVYQSRSGSPMQPWLGPDILEHLKSLAGAGVKEVAVAPIGFVSDHMEIVYDLDFEAQNLARELGMKMVRAATAGTHPSFVKMIRELMLERIDNAPARFVGSQGARTGLCAAGCCAK